MWIRRTEYVSLVAKVAELSAVRFAQDARTTELMAYVAKLEEAVAAERARTNSAVDKLLGAHGMPPVTPAVVPTIDQLSSFFEEDPAEVREIVQDIKEHGAANVLLGIN